MPPSTRAMLVSVCKCTAVPLSVCPPTLIADNPDCSGGLAGAGWHDPAIASPRLDA